MRNLESQEMVSKGGGKTHQFRLGQFTCYILFDGRSSIDLHKIFPTISRYTDEKQIHAYEAAMYINPLLVDTGEQRVLIDTGLGRDIGDGEGQLLKRLCEINISPDHIDVVIITHGHWDHIGGLTDDRGELIYKNAVYYFPEIDWEIFTSEPHLTEMTENVRQWAQEKLPPIAGCVKLFASNTEIIPGFHAVDASGHTPGHVVMMVESGGESLFFLSDAALNPFQLQYPDVWAAFDMDYDAANAMRRRLCKLAAESRLLVHGYHFPFPGLGYIEEQGAAWHWKPIR